MLSKNLAELWQSLYEDELPSEIVSQCEESECRICKTPEFSSHSMVCTQIDFKYILHVCRYFLGKEI